MSHGLQYSTTDIIAALDKVHGGVCLAAEQLGCNYKTIERRAAKVRAVADTIAKYRERRNDIAEMKLEAALIGGEAWAIQFQLRTQGKERGYSERHEVLGKSDARLVIEYINDWRTRSME